MQYKYPEGNPPYMFLVFSSFCALLISKIEYSQGKSWWWFAPSVSIALWVWVGLTLFFRAKQNRRNNKI